jgi:hypothetical protein
MIHLHDLTLKDIGRWVLYHPRYGHIQRGRLKGWNQKVIHVVYKCDGQWDRYFDFTGEATDPADLEFNDNA